MSSRKKKRSKDKQSESIELQSSAKAIETVNPPRQNENLIDDIRACTENLESLDKLEKKGERLRRQCLSEVYELSFLAHKYLGELEEHLKARRLPFNKRRSIFNRIVTLASSTNSSWERINEDSVTLEYLYEIGTPVDQVSKALKANGGIPGCLEKMAQLRHRNQQKGGYKDISSESEFENEAVWDNMIMGGGPAGEVLCYPPVPIPGDYIALGKYSEEGDFLIYQSAFIPGSVRERILHYFQS
ncbi:MAG: hypothetical protein HON07_06630 [Planctomycetaceae bacterium]|jgi:hypothetical protein|nr:hypothetical protein [Planctomycetaceae bacterium]